MCKKKKKCLFCEIPTGFFETLETLETDFDLAPENLPYGALVHVYLLSKPPLPPPTPHPSHLQAAFPCGGPGHLQWEGLPVPAVCAAHVPHAQRRQRLQQYVSVLPDCPLSVFCPLSVCHKHLVI